MIDEYIKQIMMWILVYVPKYRAQSDRQFLF